MTESSLLKTTIVVMGVSGCGKSTVARHLSERLAWPMAEGDDFHPPENKAKMSAGTPLTDEDRQPWLESLRDWIDRAPSHAIITCSALKRSYREILRAGGGRVRFLHLDGSPQVLAQRMAARKGHFMPAALLISQLETLERLEPDEDGTVVDIDRTTEEIVDLAVERLRLPV
ncbi:MAG TPA: gluconokinase [Propionibacteriaceae bacterium]|nr:gluconokinase [Propionibacteriaceae bacterium]